ncbi:MAG TPA: PLP-dependent aminotransferase family protein [Holophaga sp.]|nr:PLP-dependent aminotransferase family protein [Holophaga sp.]
METLLTLDPSSSDSLVVQIVQGLTQCILSRRWRPGSRAPSIREFARTHAVSTSTVVEAYDRLVAAGLLTARRGAGFFVTESSRGESRPGPDLARTAIDGDWLLRNVYEQGEQGINAGCGWLPESWHDVDAVCKGLRRLATHPGGLIGYGSPKGYEPLRQQIVRQLAELEIEAAPSQILLTHGASQGLDLLARRLTQPGDTVFVDDPAYSNLLSGLRLRGLRLVGVPMTPTGPDVAVLEQLLTQHQPRLYFTNTQLHNPTGASYSAAAAFQVLRLAERHQFLVVEDNVSADLVPVRAINLAGADQLKRVVYVGSFSKAIAPGLRVGFVVAEPGLLEELVYFKLVSGMSTSVVNERLVHAIFMEGHVRKHLEHLRDRLAKAQERTCRRLESAGFTLFFEPGAGMFVWAKPRDGMPDSLALSQQALERGILLAPGHLFRPDQDPCPWLRFNVVYCDNDRLFAFMAKALAGERRPAGPTLGRQKGMR